MLMMRPLFLAAIDGNTALAMRIAEKVLVSNASLSLSNGSSRSGPGQTKHVKLQQSQG
jgi:hypothetical protein